MNMTSRHENIPLNPMKPTAIMAKSSKSPALIKLVQKKLQKNGSSTSTSVSTTTTATTGLRPKCRPPIIIIGLKQKQESDGKSTMVFL